MPLPIEYANGPHGNALADFDMALTTGDQAQKERLTRLLFDHFNGRLRSKSAVKVDDYLKGLLVWRQHGAVKVYKTSDFPCVAYCSLQYDGVVSLLLLGACNSYPISEDDWWTNVIEPRLVHHL